LYYETQVAGLPIWGIPVEGDPGGDVGAMNAERLLTCFERIADAPDAIVRLRLFVLDLAVRGKLVPQDLKDEPASELLRRIAAEKARLKLKHEVLPLERNEIPFELPRGWSWSRIGEVCSKTGSGSTPRGGQAVYKNNGVIFLRSQNVYNDGLRLDDVAYIDPATHHRMSGTAVKPNDLLLNITGGSMGRCCRIPNEFGEANVNRVWFESGSSRGLGRAGSVPM
jgi:type I restriction enzyme S subunit